MITLFSIAETMSLFARRGIPIPIPVPRGYFWYGVGAVILLNLLWFVIREALTDRAQKRATEELEREHDALRRDLHNAVKRVLIVTSAADGKIEDAEIETIQRIYQQLTATNLTEESIKREAAQLNESATSMSAAVA